MPFYLSKPSGDGYVTIPNYDIPAGADFEIEFKVTTPDNVNNSTRILGRAVDVTSDVNLGPTSVSMEQSGGPNTTITFPSMNIASLPQNSDSLNNLNPWIINITRVANVLSAVATDTVTNAMHSSTTSTVTGAFNFNQLFRQGNFAVNERIDLYYLKLGDDRHYVNDTGVGVIFPDIISNQDGTLVNLDSSNWVEYGVAPNTAPVITLTSPISIDVVVGSVWDNSVIAYTASDAEDGVITELVVLDDSSVNMAVIGAYQVTLNVVDSEGLAADEVVVTVNVVEAAAIKSVTTTGPYRAGETITYATENLSPTNATLTDKRGNVLSLTNVTATTAAIPDFIADVTSGVLFGSCDLTVGDGVDEASTSVTINPPVGYNFVDVGVTPDLSINGVAYNWGRNPVEHDQVVFPSSITVDASLMPEGNDGTYTLYAALSTDPVFESFTLIMGDAEADTTAPTLSNATVTPSQTTASASVTTNEGNGTLFYLLNNQASATASAVKSAFSQPVTDAGVRTVTLTGLTVSTQYYVHFVHTDAAGNDSTVTSMGFTTLAEVVDPVDPDPEPVTGIGQISQSGLTNVINKSQPFVIHTGIRELTTGEALRGWVDNGGAHYWLTIHSYTVNDGMINTVTASVPSNTPSWGVNQGTLTLQIVNLTGN